MTIVGNGDIAAALRSIDTGNDLLFFASGVSNSQETSEAEYGREYKLLMEQPRDKRLVYFSSLAIFEAATTGKWTRYTSHKRRMEEVVKEFPKWTIIRLGNIDWGTNSHTLINFLRQQFRDGIEPTLMPVDRFILDWATFAYWVTMIPDFNCEMNIPGRQMKVDQVWLQYVKGAVCTT